MGDIAMLLTIFFMVCSNFARDAGVTLTPPISVDVEAMKDTGLSVSIDNIGVIRLNGAEVSSAKSVEVGLQTMLEKRTNDSMRIVLFKCDQAVDKKVFEPVIEAISKAGGIVAAMGEKKGR
jgi:biopolymer transport protein ExbD